MSRSWEEGENEFTRAAKQEAARTGQDIAAILERMLGAAKRDREPASRVKIVRAQKFLLSRNQQKRKKRK